MKIKKITGFILALGLLSSVSIAQVPDDDIVLSIVPTIAAISSKINTCKETGGYWYSHGCNISPSILSNTQKLAGKWAFTTGGANGSLSLTNYYFFDSSTIERLDEVSHFIHGLSTTSDFTHVSHENLGGVFDAELNAYIVTDLWGLPDRDKGRVYIFQSANRNTQGDCSYLANAKGVILPNFYKGFGGNYDCTLLTKKRL